jgi:hypothetical protein
MFLTVAAIVLAIVSALRARSRKPATESGPSRSRLHDTIAQAAEAGWGVHIALGTGSVSGDRAMVSVACLRIAREAAELAVSYGISPRLSVGDVSLLVAAQDALRRVYEGQGILDRYDPSQVRFIAPGALPFAAGAGDAIAADRPGVVVLAGAYDAGVALACDPGVRRRDAVFVAVDSGLASGVGFAATDWLAPGEGLFTAAADRGNAGRRPARITAQDVMRWVVIAGVLCSALWALWSG